MVAEVLVGWGKIQISIPDLSCLCCDLESFYLTIIYVGTFSCLLSVFSIIFQFEVNGPSLCLLTLLDMAQIADGFVREVT